MIRPPPTTQRSPLPEQAEMKTKPKTVDSWTIGKYLSALSGKVLNLSMKFRHAAHYEQHWFDLEHRTFTYAAYARH
jgi:hypothetical protein